MRTVKNSLKKKIIWKRMRESLVYHQRCYNATIIKSYWTDAGAERRKT